MSKASSNRKCVTVQNASTSSGANVFQYQYNGSGNDEWYLERVNYGVAWPFQKLGSGAPNCFGYALKLNYTPSLLMNYDDSVSVVATRVENYVRNTLGRQIRQISGPTAEINDNEYRFCMRVGNHSDYSPNRDYHFWVQTDTGAWAEKMVMPKCFMTLFLLIHQLRVGICLIVMAQYVIKIITIVRQYILPLQGDKLIKEWL